MSNQVANLDLGNNQSIDEFMENQSSHQEVIETVISSLDQEDTAMVNHSDEGILWKFQYGSVEVFVQLTGETEDDLLKVWASVLQLPAKDETKLMRKLLEMNWAGTFETCFSIVENRVVVSAQRTLTDLYPSEISRVITLVATIADDNDEALQAEFGMN
jgi:hypothetical protein